jgi:hypothetical protein
MIATLRRLDDLERYWGFTWPGWAGIATGCVTLYLAVRFSPLSFKPTVTITLFVCTFVGMVLYGVSGQALSPSRQLWAVATYIAGPKLVALAAKPERRGLVLVALPDRARLEDELRDDHVHEGAATGPDTHRRGGNSGDPQLDPDVEDEHRDYDGWDSDGDVYDPDEVDVDELEAARVDAVDLDTQTDDAAGQHDARSGDLVAGAEQTSPWEER